MNNESTEPSRWKMLEIDFTDEDRAAAERKRREYETVAEKLECEIARRENGAWVPGCGGTEVPFITRTGHRVLYCWQPSTGRHAYLNCDGDMIIPDSELSAYGLGA
jgi:hypothetical protein